MITVHKNLQIESYYDADHKSLVHYSITRLTDGKEVKFGFFPNIYPDRDDLTGVLQDTVDEFVQEDI
jgi:hypothetical protein